MNQPTLVLSHFTAALVFSILVSIVFGVTHRNTPREMARYGMKCFIWFIGGLFFAGWAMFLLRWLATK